MSAQPLDSGRSRNCFVLAGSSTRSIPTWNPSNAIFGIIAAHFVKRYRTPKSRALVSSCTNVAKASSSVLSPQYVSPLKMSVKDSPFGLYSSLKHHLSVRIHCLTPQVLVATAVADLALRRLEFEISNLAPEWVRRPNRK